MIVPYTNDIEKYLEYSNIIDYTSREISDLAEVLVAGHGICFAKSHLLAALL